MPIIVRRSIRYRSVPRSTTPAARSPTRPSIPAGAPLTLPVVPRERRARSPPPLSVSLRNKLEAEERPGSAILQNSVSMTALSQPVRRDPARIQDDKSLLTEAPLMVSVDFEVFGETQGTYFLKYAREMCDKLGLKGWVRLSKRSTVIGQIQGEKSHVDEMALWLRLQGAPGCRIDHTEFTNWSIVDRLDYKTFTMRF